MAGAITHLHAGGALQCHRIKISPDTSCIPGSLTHQEGAVGLEGHILDSRCLLIPDAHDGVGPALHGSTHIPGAMQGCKEHSSKYVGGGTAMHKHMLLWLVSIVTNVIAAWASVNGAKDSAPCQQVAAAIQKAA